MKTFKYLSVNDFPGIDAKKFDDWKQAVIRTRGIIYVVLLVYIILNIKSYGIAGYILYDTPIVMLIGFLLISQYTRYVTIKHTTYIMVSLSVLILFNIFFVFITGRFVVESLITIVVFFWLYNQNQKHNKSAIEMGIDITTLKRVLSQ
jgi:antibiotic biosynthesis monooxygenase (ABM) superfamily enzyme